MQQQKQFLRPTATAGHNMARGVGARHGQTQNTLRLSTRAALQTKASSGSDGGTPELDFERQPPAESVALQKLRRKYLEQETDRKSTQVHGVFRSVAQPVPA